MSNVTGEPLSYEATLDNTQFGRAMNQMRNEISGVTSNLQNQSSQVESFASKAAAAAAGYFSIQAASSFLQSIVQVRGEFQKIEVAYKTMLGSKEKADQLMAESVKLAATTPFGLQDVASGSKQLLAYGFAAKDITGNLEMLGNIAAGVGSQLNDVVYLYGTLKASGRVTQTDINQFAGRGIPIYDALSKAMQISVSEVKNYVEAGKVGFPQVEQAFKNLTGSGGMFFNLMQEQSKTLTGQLSNLEDAWSQMLNELGKDSQGFFSAGISAAIDLVENYQKVLDIMGTLIVAYGSYRAALIAYTAINTLATASQIGMTAAQISGIFFTETMTKAVKLLNAAMTVNPYVAAATAIAALGTYIYMASEDTKKLLTATELYNEAASEQGNVVNTAESKLAVYLETLKNQNISEDQRLSIYEKIKSIDPSIVSGIDAKTISYTNLKGRVDDYIKSLREKFRVEAQETAIKASISNENDLRTDVDEYTRYTDQYLAMFKLTREDLKKNLDNLPDPVRYQYEKELKRRDLLLKQQVETNKLIGTSSQNGSKEQIAAINKDIQILTSQTARYKKGSVEYIEVQRQIEEKQDQLNKMRNIKAGKTATVEEKAVPQNKAFFEALIKKNTEDLEALDRADKDFNAKAEPLRKRIADAKASLLSFDVSGKAGKIAGKIADSENSALKRQAEMLQKIYDLNDKYNNKSLTEDEQKLAEIRSEFKALQADIEIYNKDPKNKKVNPNLKPALEKALANQNYLNETDRVKVELDRQKDLYVQYEDFKSTVGKQAADERFKNELDTSVSFMQKMEAERAKLLDKDPTQMSGPELERLQYFNAIIDEEYKAEKKKYDDLMKEFVSYYDARKALTQEYEADLASFEGNPEAQAQRKSKYDEDLKTLDETNVNKLDAFRALFGGIENLSDQNAKKVIANAENMLNTLILSGNLSKAVADNIRKLITNTKKDLTERMPDRLINLANQIDRVAEAVSGVDENFGKMLSTLGNVVGQVGNIKKGMLDLKDAQGLGENGMEDFSSMGQLTAGLGIFGAGISILSSVSKLFDKSAQREEQAAYARDLQNKQTEAMNKALERQIELIDEAYGTERITQYNAAIAQATADQVKYQQMLQGRYSKTGNKFVDDIFAKANAGDKNALFGIKNINDLKSFQLPSDLKALQKLLEEDKLDAGTAVIVTNLIQATEAAKDLKNNLNSENIGTSLDSIADSFVSALTDGTKDFGKTFEDIIKTSILNGFKGQLIEKQLQPFYDAYAEYSKDGLTKDEITKLQAMRDQILIDGEKELKNLEQITGVKLTDQSQKSSGGLVSNSIKSITQDQANALEGLSRGEYSRTIIKF